MVRTKADFALEELSNLAVMQGVDLEVIRPFLENCPCFQLEPESLLLTPRSSRDEVYLLLQGRLRIHLQSPEDAPISTIEMGESVGELSLLVNGPRSAFVVAEERCRLLEICNDSFWLILNASPQLAINYLRMLSLRIRKSNERVLESRNLQQQYRRHAMTDGLTGLYNRRWFNEIFPRIFQRSVGENLDLSLVYVDIDHFKKFNDEHGHQTGDYVLFIVAQVLRSNFRTTDLIARYGGEEFAIIMPRTDIEEAFRASERVRKAMQDTHLETPNEIALPSITISLGIALRQAEEAPEQLMQRTDQALYKAKREGRNRTEIHTGA